MLAAGAARRFGGGKLSANFRGEPLLHHAIRAALAAPVERVAVVCAPALDIGQWPDTRVERLEFDSAELSASLKAGVAAVADAEGVFVFLGDMPLVPHELAGLLAEAIGDQFAAQPLHEGKPGHPVLLSPHACSAINALEGDRGAGSLLRARTDVVHLDVSDPGVLLDVDEVQDLARLNGPDGLSPTRSP